jgi:hypothetical protein
VVGLFSSAGLDPGQGFLLGPLRGQPWPGSSPGRRGEGVGAGWPIAEFARSPSRQDIVIAVRVRSGAEVSGSDLLFVGPGLTRARAAPLAQPIRDG